MNRKLGFILALGSVVMWYGMWFNINMNYAVSGDTVDWLQLYSDRLTAFNWVGVAAITGISVPIFLDGISLLIRSKSLGVVPALRSLKN